jgi:hypothetical protein
VCEGVRLGPDIVAQVRDLLADEPSAVFAPDRGDPIGPPLVFRAADRVIPWQTVVASGTGWGQRGALVVCATRR